MKVFVMWSGDLSKAVAIALRDFLEAVVQGPDYFISGAIKKGELWDAVIAGELETTHYGIACLTRDNLESPWIHFEAGAISKVSESAKVMPYLIGAKAGDVTGPLKRFQMTLANEDETWALVQSLNEIRGDDSVPEPALRRAFDGLWPTLKIVIDKASVAPKKVAKDKPDKQAERSQEDVLDEVLRTVRDLERRMTRKKPSRAAPLKGDPSEYLQRASELLESIRASGTGAQFREASEAFSRLRTAIDNWEERGGGSLLATLHLATLERLHLLAETD